MEMLPCCLSEQAGDKGKDSTDQICAKEPFLWFENLEPMKTIRKQRGRSRSDSFIAGRHRTWKRLESAAWSGELDVEPSFLPSLRQRLHLSEEIHGKSFHQNLAPPTTPRPKRECSNSKEKAAPQGKENTNLTCAKQLFLAHKQHKQTKTFTAEILRYYWLRDPWTSDMTER